MRGFLFGCDEPVGGKNAMRYDDMSAYGRGWEDRRSGKYVETENPYERGTLQHDEWLKGYRDFKPKGEPKPTTESK